MATTSIGTATDLLEPPVFRGAASQYNMAVATVEWTLTGTYAAGGFTYASSDVGGITDVRLLEFPSGPFSDGTNFGSPRWDRANSKVEMVGTLAYEEAADGYDFSNFAGIVRAYGY